MFHGAGFDPTHRTSNANKVLEPRRLPWRKRTPEGDLGSMADPLHSIAALADLGKLSGTKQEFQIKPLI
jgi:hypothetical protein